MYFAPNTQNSSSQDRKNVLIKTDIFNHSDV